MKNYILKIADDSLIMAQRLSEWCGKGPYLEEDVAVVNIALDYLGQSSNFYKYAANLDNTGKSEDDFAMLRLEKEYLNAQLVEFPNGDYAQTILKIYFFSVYLQNLYGKLTNSTDEQLSALAQKSLKEVRYHYTHAVSWLTIFGNGTTISKEKLENALQNLWEYTGGLFDEVEDEDHLVKLEIIPSSQEIKELWTQKVTEDFKKFGLEIPENKFMQKGSRKGIHTEYFGFILCELQYMQRTYPSCTW